MSRRLSDQERQFLTILKNAGGYTIPTRDAEGEYSCQRYDHDEGGWKDWAEGLSIKIIDESDLLDLEERAETAEARIKALEEALRPFAAHIDEMKFDLDNKGNELPDTQAVGWIYVTNGDFRRARSALSSTESQSK